MNQADLQLLATERIRDAEALLAGQRWAFAYYTAGYAVECGLKSSILARMVVTGGIFEDKKFAADCWIHDFSKLIGLAGLTNELDDRLAESEAAGDSFIANWGIVLQWQEIVRYKPKTEQEARDIYRAITDNPDGVMQWIRNYW